MIKSDKKRKQEGLCPDGKQGSGNLNECEQEYVLLLFYEKNQDRYFHYKITHEKYRMSKLYILE
jgi:hypothetical protein